MTLTPVKQLTYSAVHRDLAAPPMFSRRELSTQIAASLTVLGTAATVFPSGPTAQEQGATLFTWQEYESGAFYGDYIAKYGRAPDLLFWGDPTEGLAKLQSTAIADVAHPCSDVVRPWHDLGLIQPIDIARLSHWSELWPFLTMIEGTHINGKPLFVPFDWGYTSLVYRTDLVSIEYPSWNLLFDKQLEGRIATYNNPELSVELAALALGFENVFELSDEQLHEVTTLLVKQQELKPSYWTDVPDLAQGLQSGEVVAAAAWTGSIEHLQAQGVPVNYAIPAEGVLIWVCGLALVANGPGSEEAAYDLIDTMIAPKSGSSLIENYGYGHSNQTSFEFVSQSRLRQLGLERPDDIFEHGILFRELSPDLRNKYNDVFQLAQSLPNICESQTCKESCEGRCEYCPSCAP